MPGSGTPLSRLLARDEDLLRFQLEVCDTLGLIPSDYDTVTVAVREPGDIFDYLRISRAASPPPTKAFGFQSPARRQFSHFTNDTVVTLEGPGPGSGLPPRNVF